MITRRSTSRAGTVRFGCSGDTLDLPCDSFESLLYKIPFNVHVPQTVLPIKRQNVCRIALLASLRVAEGLQWHATCHELTPLNWHAVLSQSKPDYLLVESCIYDSAFSWNCFAFNRYVYVEKIKKFTETARCAHIPSIFWYTLDVEMLDFFIDAMKYFDFIACADARALERIRQYGLPVRPLPWGFSPEQFNPLMNVRVTDKQIGLLFDGIVRFMRSEELADILESCTECNLTVVDSWMTISPYNFSHCKRQNLIEYIGGCVSQKNIQELYKISTAYLSLENTRQGIAPGEKWRCLEAAACRLPVLHYGSYAKDDYFLSEFVESYSSLSDLKAMYFTMQDSFIERERHGHVAWRRVHEKHTFAHRLDRLHGWIGLKSNAVREPLVSIVVPSFREENQSFVLQQFRKQTWRNKELIYAFNGNGKKCNIINECAQQSSDVKVLHLPLEYSTGMVLNAGITTANGDFLFKMDDDDLYGDFYVYDRMIYFREFNCSVIFNVMPFFSFGNGSKAFLFTSSRFRMDRTVTRLGQIKYGLTSTLGTSVAMGREHALRLGYQGHAYGYVDISLLFKEIAFSSDEPCIIMDPLNFCVQRGEPEQHTWAAGQKEVENWGKKYCAAKNAIFI